MRAVVELHRERSMCGKSARSNQPCRCSHRLESAEYSRRIHICLVLVGKYQDRTFSITYQAAPGTARRQRRWFGLCHPSSPPRPPSPSNDNVIADEGLGQDTVPSFPPKRRLRGATRPTVARTPCSTHRSAPESSASAARVAPPSARIVSAMPAPSGHIPAVASRRAVVGRPASQGQN